MRAVRPESLAGLLVVPCLALHLTGCQPPPQVELKGQRFTVEVVDDDAGRSRGLMFRDELKDDHGMLFVWDRAEPRAFWMKNTKIPLDILYFDERLRLVSVARDTPPCTLGDACPSYPSKGPAQYVLEVNAGTAARLGVAEGDELRLYLPK